jgi:hypothetical protein
MFCIRADRQWKNTCKYYVELSLKYDVGLLVHKHRLTEDDGGVLL